MKIRQLILGPLQTNCYLVSDEAGQSAVIDPAEAEPVLEMASREGLSIRAVLLTHGHFDHVGGVKALMQALHCPVYVNERDLALPQWLRGELAATDDYGEGDTVAVGALRFTVLETPGHTEGSVCLRCGGALFSGDTLFAGACGRTDLPGGDWQKMQKSLARLAALPEDAAVYPGHGAHTTLYAERR